MSITSTSALGGTRVRQRLLRGGVLAIGALTLFALAAQGGINGGGRARGVITAFGSIFVNGVEYELDRLDDHRERQARRPRTSCASARSSPSTGWSTADCPGRRRRSSSRATCAVR